MSSDMGTALPIGDFARATHLSVKTLRYYHQVGLIEPSDIDAHTGYRRYRLEQIPTAQIVRRLRDLDMPVDDVREVLIATDLEARNALLVAHLARLEDDLTRTRTAVESLRDLLRPDDASPGLRPIGRRRVAATTAAAITAVITIGEAERWYRGALGEVAATLQAQGIATTGAGGMFTGDLFAEDRGRATIFAATAQPVEPVGRVTSMVVPAAELATIVHLGSHTNIDLAYGDLATHVATHALAVDGPIREYYLTSPLDTPDSTQWRTEIGWPTFHTGPDPAEG